MPQSLVQIYVHIVFSTHERRPFLQQDVDLKEALRILGGICNDMSCPVLRVGGVEDHVHILCRLGKQTDISELIMELKRCSSIAIKSKVSDFYWQEGYGAFSVSPSHVDKLLDYIANQAEHHKKESFQDEFRRLLSHYGLKWDERYVWG